MQHSIATVSLSGTLPEKLEAIASAGFHGVEIFENDLLYFEGSPADVRRLCADLGLEIMLFQPFRDFEGGRRERLAHHLERAKRKFELMHELGTRRILVCSNVQADTSRDDAIIVDDLHQLAQVAAEHDVLVGYEALAWGQHVRSYRQVWDIVKTVDHPNLGIILDSFHTLSLNDDLSRLSEIPGDKIVFLQLADAPRMQMDVLEWSRHFRCFPGQGDFDLAGFLLPVLQSGYQGPLSLEIFNDSFRAAPTAMTAADGRRSLLYLEEITRQAALEQDPLDKAQLSAKLTATPAVPHYQGVEFLEFAVDEDAASRLARWFEQLGFYPAGQHKSKNVQWYRHGEINLMLNAEPDSFAQAFFASHGPSLCATAFQVADSAAAVKRAKQYGASSFEGRVGPNERHIPAVRAPDGSLHYLVDSGDQAASIYPHDFDLLPVPTQTQDTLQRIDHFALGLPAETLDTWKLFFRAVYGFRGESEQVLPDPYGLIKSRVLRSENGTIRIPLNISENRNTAIARSVSTYRGSGVQHIAFATTDIFAAVSAARDHGLPLLEIPRNYYDDLAARFDLSDDFIEKLAAANILYDQDNQGGELLQVYTEQFEQRFFFELIERRHGYQQYGAANAAVRLAAQAQSRARRQA